VDEVGLARHDGASWELLPVGSISRTSSGNSDSCVNTCWSGFSSCVVSATDDGEILAAFIEEDGEDDGVDYSARLARESVTEFEGGGELEEPRGMSWGERMALGWSGKLSFLARSSDGIYVSGPDAPVYPEETHLLRRGALGRSWAPALHEQRARGLVWEEEPEAEDEQARTRLRLSRVEDEALVGDEVVDELLPNERLWMLKAAASSVGDIVFAALILHDDEGRSSLTLYLDDQALLIDEAFDADGDQVFPELLSIDANNIVHFVFTRNDETRYRMFALY
jgi:hypothetical protein